ncbi:glutamine amidotransferase-related protein [Thauera sp.]|uniref:glutamine amidotransferase-related protein n=1 Tax=Thauera sp. TaxID=1905334 RepID=UPI0039E67507
MVSDHADWSERLGQWLKTCVDAEVPVLGICYGHQLLAHALGGRVRLPSGGTGDRHPRHPSDARGPARPLVRHPARQLPGPARAPAVGADPPARRKRAGAQRA